MARENQKLQVGLIISIMLIVVLLTTTFFGFRSANEYSVRMDSEKKRADQAEMNERRRTSELQYMKVMLGAGETTLQALEAAGLQLDEQLTKVKQQFDQDMLQYGKGLPEAELNYRGIVKNLTVAIRTANEQLANAEAREQQLNNDLQSKTAELTTRAQTAETARKTAEDKLTQVSQVFDQDRQKFVAQTSADQDKISTLTQNLADVQSAAQKQEQNLLQKITQQDNQIIHLNQIIDEMHKDTFEIPDGRVVNVNQRARLVWLNLGHLDGLRAQTSFSVYDQGTSAVQGADPKGRIEVTRVIEGHLSEARIIEDQLTNPIVRGDVVYTPAWRAGRKIRFAIAGMMDINDDGVSDLELVRNIIRMNGGEIDAELQDDGTIAGKGMSVGTRFLVLGEPPTERTQRDNPQYLASFTEMSNQASRFGVEILKIDSFLNLMGWKPEIRTVGLSERSSDEVNRANAFRPRNPPARGTNGGAYDE